MRDFYGKALGQGQEGWHWYLGLGSASHKAMNFGVCMGGLGVFQLQAMNLAWSQSGWVDICTNSLIWLHRS